MTLTRSLAVAIALLLPVAVAGTAEASPHKRHPLARVQTATHKVTVPARGQHKLHVAKNSSRSFGQAHRHGVTRRG